MAKLQSKNFILTKKIDDILYELLPKTNSDMVYVDDKTTLTEKLSELTELLTNFKGDEAQLRESFNTLVKDAPEMFNTFKEVWDYVNINGEPKSELIQLINSKQTAEEGKGLSTHDLDDLLYEKLTNLYSKDDLDIKFNDIENSNVEISNRINNLEEKIQLLPDIEGGGDYIPLYSCWGEILSKE